jgi:asparagine synthase (glutamine-hydrolysing)
MRTCRSRPRANADTSLVCGILGILAARPIALSDAAASHLRDTMTHRGPDAAGLWRKDGCILAHRRLKVVDTSDDAAQPMTTADGRYTIVYNGELYNDADLRAELASASIRFRTNSDTETVLAALATWGAAAIPRLRGMYAFGFYDATTRTMLLARDGLGIKPLYYRLGPTSEGEALIFASEPHAILQHPDVPVRPDWITISAYLTTIRTVMGERTLFEGVRTLRPGEVLEFAVRGDELTQRRHSQQQARASTSHFPASSNLDRVGTRLMVALVRDSIHRHLRSDVPLCCMLSGGLDSSIIARVARDALPTLATYCSGAEGAEDFRFARQMSEHAGTRHTEAPISREVFASRWPEMITRLGTPLSTPNEVAINQIARRMRADGFIVALSGEGADELFGGYDIPMLDAARFEGLLPRDPDRDAAWFRPGILHGGDFQLAANAWIQPRDKPAILGADLWRACEHDDMLVEFYRAEFDAAEDAAPSDSPLQAHLQFHRRINLAGLLSRLDTSTMLEGIEGRTPLADAIVCAAAESLPMSDKFTFERPFSCRSLDPASSALLPRTQTKRILRQAFSDVLTAEVTTRPKASFPLPMTEWVADQAQVLRRSPFAREAFTMPALETVAAHPSQCWPLAWPMINIAMWGDSMWA